MTLELRPSTEIKADIERLQKELEKSKLEESQWPKLFNITLYEDDDDGANEFCQDVLLLDPDSPEYYEKGSAVYAAAYQATLYFEVDREFNVTLVGAECGEVVGTPDFLDKYNNPDYNVGAMDGDYWQPKRARLNREKRLREKNATEDAESKKAHAVIDGLSHLAVELQQ